MLGWGIGLYGGRPLLERHGRWFHLTPDKLDRAERWFDRYEVWTVCVGRMIPLVRSFISIPAGVFEVRFGPYAILTLLGTIPWCFGLAAVGLAVGTGWESFHERFSWARLRRAGTRRGGPLLHRLPRQTRPQRPRALGVIGRRS